MSQLPENKNTDVKVPASTPDDLLRAGKELTKFWKDMKPSFWEPVFKFIFHPFVLLGGIIAAIYFFAPWRRAGRESVTAPLSDRENNKLRAELKALKKRNRRLKKHLAALDDEHDSEPGYGTSTRRRRSSRGGQPTTVYLD